MGLFGPPDVEKLKANRNVKGLVKTLAYEKDAIVRRKAAKALGQIGDVRAADPLIVALKDNDYSVRKTAVDALVMLGDARAVEPLIAALKDKSTSVRLAIIESLGKIGDVRAVEPLVSELKEEIMRQAAARALTKIGKPAVELLIAALMDSNKGARIAVVDVLDEIGWHPGKDVSGAAYWIIKEKWDEVTKIGVPAAEPLITVLMDGDSSVHEIVADALDKIGWQPGKDESGAAYWVTKGRLDKCIEIGAPAVELLIAVLKEKDVRVCSEAAYTLGQIGDVRAVEPLITVLNIDKLNIRQAAARALTRIYTIAQSDEKIRTRIYGLRTKIIESHVDEMNYRDEWVGEQRCAMSYHDDGMKHLDEGIGVDFLL